MKKAYQAPVVKIIENKFDAILASTELIVDIDGLFGTQAGGFEQ